MTNIAAFIGEPLDFGGKLKIYPPKIKEVITNPNYGVYSSLFTLSEDDIKDELKKEKPDLEIFPTPFEFLLINAYNHQSAYEKIQEAFEFFCHTKVTFLFNDKKILIGEIDLTQPLVRLSKDAVFLEEEEYFNFQNLIRSVCGIKELIPPEPENPDENPMIAEIKRRARERDRIKAKHNNKNGISLETCLAAICCMGIGITPLNIGEMSYASVGTIMKMMQEKEKYDIDIRSLLAGADSKKIKPKYWIRNNSNE